MSKYSNFASGYEAMCNNWDLTTTGSSVESMYELAQEQFGVDAEDVEYTWPDEQCLGVLVAFLHLNGADV